MVNDILVSRYLSSSLLPFFLAENLNRKEIERVNCSTLVRLLPFFCRLNYKEYIYLKMNSRPSKKVGQIKLNAIFNLQLEETLNIISSLKSYIDQQKHRNERSKVHKSCAFIVVVLKGWSSFILQCSASFFASWNSFLLLMSHKIVERIYSKFPWT